MAQTFKNHTAANYAPVQRRHAAADKALEDQRKKAIKAVKAKQRQLGMDEPTYRAMLKARTGKDSASHCTLTELGNVNGYLTAHGAVWLKPQSSARPVIKRPVIASDRQALRGKVTMLLADLVDEAGVTDSVAYVNAICNKNGWCTAIDFADAHILHKLVGALSHTLKAKRARNASA